MSGTVSTKVRLDCLDSQIIVYAPRGAVYDVVYTGSPAKKMKYTLMSQEKTLEMIVRIAYPGAESRQILKDGQRVDMNAWNENI